MTAPLGEASASGLSIHYGMMVKVWSGVAASELSRLAWRMRGSRESWVEGVQEILQVGRKQDRKVSGCWHSGRQVAEAPFHTFSLCCLSSMAGLGM